MGEKRTPVYGAIEAGGTKFVLAIGTGPDDIRKTVSIPTTKPEETLRKTAQWFADGPKVDAIGIASFGPVELDKESPNWGYITDTPKPGWSNTNLAGYFAKSFDVPVGFETDVNGAVLGEYLYGAAKNVRSAIYVTVGTGIGAGAIVDGKIVHGSSHPEMGHIFPRRHAADTDFTGSCSFHDDCLEGLACGPAIVMRWDKNLSELPQDHEAHSIIACYLAQLCHSLQATLSPDIIILGGGVLQTEGLLEKIRIETAQLAGNYFQKTVQIVLASTISSPAILGAFDLARTSLSKRE